MLGRHRAPVGWNQWLRELSAVLSKTKTKKERIRYKNRRRNVQDLSTNRRPIPLMPRPSEKQETYDEGKRESGGAGTCVGVPETADEGA